MDLEVSLHSLRSVSSGHGAKPRWAESTRGTTFGPISFKQKSWYRKPVHFGQRPWRLTGRSFFHLLLDFTSQEGSKLVRSIKFFGESASQRVRSQHFDLENVVGQGQNPVASRHAWRHARGCSWGVTDCRTSLSFEAWNVLLLVFMKDSSWTISPKLLQITHCISSKSLQINQQNVSGWFMSDWTKSCIQNGQPRWTAYALHVKSSDPQKSPRNHAVNHVLWNATAKGESLRRGPRDAWKKWARRQWGDNFDMLDQCVK